MKSQLKATRKGLAAARALSAGLCGTLLCLPAAHAADEPVMLPLESIYLLPQRGVRLPSADQTARQAIAAAEPTPSEKQRPEPLYGTSPARTVLMEMQSPEFTPGRFNRPKYALGFRSDAMKSFAQGLGLDADTCLLPLVRARVSLSQDAGTGGRVMVFARCTFH